MCTRGIQDFPNGWNDFLGVRRSFGGRGEVAKSPCGVAGYFDLECGVGRSKLTGRTA